LVAIGPYKGVGMFLIGEGLGWVWRKGWEWDRSGERFRMDSEKGWDGSEERVRIKGWDRSGARKGWYVSGEGLGWVRRNGWEWDRSGERVGMGP